MKSFAPPDATGMKDYFDVYVQHEAELNEHLLMVCRGIPGLKVVIDRMSPEQMAQQRKEGLDLLRQAAVERNWGPLLASQRAQGPVYATMNIPFSEWFDLVGAFQKVMVPHLVNAYARDPQRLSRTLGAMSDYVDQAMSAIGEEYLRAKEKIISQQADSIQELSTPVLQVRDRLLLIPIVGVLDTHRARGLTESLLRAVREHRAQVVVIDITGVAAVDSRVANHLFQTVAAARLMGAYSIVTGLSAEVAEALVVLGIDITRLNTVGDLQGGLEQANQFLEEKGHYVRAGAEAR
jgi:rsbT co-antagonist protein RsbR